MKSWGRKFQTAVAIFTVLTFAVPLGVSARGGGGGGGGHSSGGGGRGLSAPSRSVAPSHYSTSEHIRTPAPASDRKFSVPSAAPTSPAPGRAISSTGSDSKVVVPQSGSATRSGPDAAAQRARSAEESKSNFQTSNAPKASSGGPTSDFKTANSGYRGEPAYQSRREQSLRESNARLRGENRVLREQQAFGRNVQPYPAVYHDSISPMFWGFMLGSMMSSHDRDMYVYHHRDEMSEERYQDLLRHDTDMSRRLAALEAQGVQKDPTYAPAGIEPALMYVEKKNEGHGFFYYVLWVLGIGGAGVLAWWLIFKKRWS